MRNSAPLVLAAGLLASACAQPQPTIRTGDGMIDPETQVLKPQFVDQSFSLAALYEAHLGTALPNSDRRSMDNALETALALPPTSPATPWFNSVTDASGSVDLRRWELDRRQGELCGAFDHKSSLGGGVEGAFTICRASTDPAWVLDEAVWRDTRPTRTSEARPRRPAPRADPPPPPVASPPSNAGQRPAGYRPPRCPEGAGAQTLGDCLAAPN